MSTMIYGPHTTQVVALLDQLRNMTADHSKGISTLDADLYRPRAVDYRRRTVDARVRAYKHAGIDRVLALIQPLAAAIPAALEAVWTAKAGEGGAGLDDSLWDIAAAMATSAVVAVVLQDILEPADYWTLTAALAVELGVTL